MQSVVSVDMLEELDLEEAARLLGTTAPALRRKINTDENYKSLAVAARKGSRHVWKIPRSNIDGLKHIKHHIEFYNYDLLYKEWLALQANGYLVGTHLSPKSIQANEYGMEKFWQHLGADKPSVALITLQSLRFALSQVPIDHENQNCHYTQREQLYKGFRSFYKLLIEKGLRSEADLLLSKKYKPKRIYERKVRICRPDDFTKLIEANTLYQAGTRSDFDRALFKTLISIYYLAGLRLSEAFHLRLEDVDLSHMNLFVRKGKGNKQRDVTIRPKLLKYLQEWLTWRSQLDDKGPYFLLQGSGAQITNNVVKGRLKRLCDYAGVPMNAHAFRHGFVTDLDAAGLSHGLIMTESGHQTLKAFQGYLNSDKKMAREFILQIADDEQ